MKILFILLFSMTVMAQHSEQPVKEDNTDLRDQTVMFKIEEVGNKRSWTLERSPSFTNVIRRSVKGEEEIRKIDGRIAQKLDREFAMRFLKCQYELPVGEGQCKVMLRLSMKGESQEICEKDDKKSQEIQAFLDELSKRF